MVSSVCLQRELSSGFGLCGGAHKSYQMRAEASNCARSKKSGASEPCVMQSLWPLDRSPSVALGADRENASCSTAPALLNVREHVGLRCSLQVYRPALLMHHGGFKPPCTSARHYSKSKYSRIKWKDFTAVLSFFCFFFFFFCQFTATAEQRGPNFLSAVIQKACAQVSLRGRKVVGKYPLSLVSTPQISALAPKRLLSVQETIRRRKKGRKLRSASQMKGRF